MATMRIRHFTHRAQKHGPDRYYWQPSKALAEKGWKLERLPDDRAAALAKAESINARVDQWRAGVLDGKTDKAETGTIDALIELYEKSARYKTLGERTTREYDFCLNVISEWAGPDMARYITREMVQDLYDTMKVKLGERRAAYVIQILRMLYNFAPKPSFVPEGYNPASKPRLTYKARKGKIWSQEAITAFIKAADAMDYFSLGTAVMINEWIGQRMGDILRLPESAYVEGTLTVGEQNKTGAEVPPLDLRTVAPHLAERIEEQIRRNRARKRPGKTLIQQEDGLKFGESTFSKCVKRIREEGEKAEPSLKGMVFAHLRHTAVTRMAEAGCSNAEIAANTGHSLDTIEAILDRYLIRTSTLANSGLAKRAAKERGEA